MSSAGQIVGAIAGGVIGFFATGGNPYGAIQGAVIGSSIGGYIDPPPGPNLRGPTLEDKSFQSSAYGVSIPRLYGTIATMGNIIYLENNEYKAVSKKESQGGKGGGGGSTYESTTYFATFAVALGEAMPGCSPLRIWAGGKLIYEIRVAGAEYVTVQFQFYDGTQTEPDSRMESVLGIGNCPSYEGTAYIIFYDFELTDFGNGLAGCPIKVEIGGAEFSDEPELVDVLTVQFPDDWLPGPSTLRPMLGPRTFTANVTRNTVSNEAIFSGHVERLPPKIRFSVVATGVSSSGNITGVCSSSSSAVDYDYIDSEGNRCIGVLVDNVERRNGYSRFPLKGSGAYVSPYRVYDKPNSPGLMFLGRASPSLDPELIGPIEPNGWYLSRFEENIPVIDFDDSNSDPGCVIVGNQYCVRIAAGSPTVVYVYDYTGETVSSFEIVMPYLFAGGRGVYRPGMFFDENKVIFLLSGISRTASGDLDFLVVDIVAETVEYFHVIVPGTETTSGVDYPSIAIYGNLICVGQNIGNHGYRFWLIDMMPIDSATGSVYLQDIVDQWLLLSGLDYSQLDTSDLAGKIVKGYRVSEPSSARGALQQLQAIHMFDFVEDGYIIRAVNRGSDASITIQKSDFISMDRGLAYKKSTDSLVLMPSRYTVNYLDPVREYDSNSQYADYPSAYFSEKTINFAVVMSADDAARQSDILIKTTWNENSTFQFQLPQSYLGLKPGNVVGAEFQQGIYTRIRIEDVSESEAQILSLTARSTQVYTYQSDATGSESSVPPSSSPVFIVDTGAILMDLPLISDSLDFAGFLVGAIGSDAGWSGSFLYRSVDAGQAYSAVERFSGNTTCGTTGSSLVANGGFLIDSASLIVWPAIGVFESATFDQMMAGKNYIAYGVDGRWEICQYQDATPMLDGSIVLSTFVRGLGGTEWASGLHKSGDYVVLLEDPDNKFIGASGGSIGVVYKYKMPTIGQLVSDAKAQDFAYMGVNLRPLSPVGLTSSRIANVWTFSFYERSRYQDSFWYSGITAKREDGIRFEMDIFKAGFVVRTLNSATTTFTYTSAEQIADFGTNQATILGAIYQINNQMGRGYPLQVNV